ncbi:MAG: N-acetylmuramoyl-L-alanine amidase, partial [Myxococcales bacterium]|nr:N-acetylmuramoyl-L-alanine amidase [Myxococcales bacterium]
RGWCDIGYHFVISQSGLIFEARRGEDRPAAHVENQNTGNIGFSFIGNYEEQRVPDVQLEAAARIMGWALRTHTGVQATREFIKGHREWPGQNTACPGDNLFARLDEIIAKAVGDTPPPPPDGQVRFEARWLTSPPDRDGAGLPDALEGEAMEAVVILRNGTAGPIRNVRLGYSVGAGLIATDYTIESDAPSFDGASFGVNDADAAPENPPKDGLVGDGELVLYAFAAGETKRVRIALKPDAYGEPHRRALRLWATNIDGIYRHPDFGARPELNTQDGLMRQALDLDVVHPAAWTWDGPATREGWDPCGDVPTPVWFREGDGLIGLAGEVGPCVISAPWAAVDAGRFDALALSLRADGATRDVRVAWAPAGASFRDEHGLVFRVPGDGQWRVWRLPVGGRPGWQGTLGRLMITGAVGFPEGAAGAGDTQIDAVWAQATGERASATEALPYTGEAPEIIEDAGGPPVNPGRDQGPTPRLD